MDSVLDLPSPGDSQSASFPLGTSPGGTLGEIFSLLDWSGLPLSAMATYTHNNQIIWQEKCSKYDNFEGNLEIQVSWPKEIQIWLLQEVNKPDCNLCSRAHCAYAIPSKSGSTNANLVYLL